MGIRGANHGRRSELNSIGARRLTHPRTPNIASRKNRVTLMRPRITAWDAPPQQSIYPPREVLARCVPLPDAFSPNSSPSAFPSHLERTRTSPTARCGACPVRAPTSTSTRARCWPRSCSRACRARPARSPCSTTSSPSSAPACPAGRSSFRTRPPRRPRPAMRTCPL